MKNILLGVIISLLVILLGNVPSRAKGAETIKLLSPETNSVVNGIVNIRWFTTGSGIKSAKIFISKGSCNSAKKYFGDIYIVRSKFATTNQNAFLYKWDTASPLINALSLEDGDYCLTASTSYGMNGGTLVEDSIDIKLDSSLNRSPQILNRLGTIFMDPGSKFSIDIDGSDLDGDTLTYTLVKAPSFLEIDSASGNIRTSGHLRLGIHTITIGISDSKGGDSKKTFILNVIKDSSKYRANEGLTFLTDSNIFGHQVNLTWKWLDIPHPQLLQYSTDGSHWVDISNISKDLDSFMWDTSSLPMGVYYIRSVVKYGVINKYAMLSPRIFLADITSNVIDTHSPGFTNLYPADGEKYSNNISAITGEFSLPVGKDLSHIEVLVNGSTVLNNCEVKGINFVCRLTKPLTTGVNKYKIKLVDTSNEETVSNGTFTVMNTRSDKLMDNKSAKIGSVLMPAALVVGGAMCIVIFLKFKNKLLGYVLHKRDSGKGPDTDDIKSKTHKSPVKSNEVEDNGEFDPYSIGSNKVVLEDSISAKDNDGKVVSGDSNSSIDGNSMGSLAVDDSEGTKQIIDLSKSSNTSLPATYIVDNEELPDWLKNIDDGADPVGIEPGEMDKSKPLAGTQPHGMSPKKDF